MNKAVAIIVVIVILALAGYAWYANKNTPKLLNTVSYQCDAGKTIDAKFYDTPGLAKPTVEGQPPTPTGSASIVLSDGRAMTLSQTISADGARYANADESFVFWSKGNGALVLENNQQQSYTGCVEVVADPGGLPHAYSNGTEGFSLRYPDGYTVDESYKYQALGPGKDIGGVKFTIASTTATGTNLSSFDTGVSVEEIPAAATCDASLFVDQGTDVMQMTDQGVDYSMAETSGAGAGNFYDEQVWALPGTNPCIAVRYFIHSTNIANYPPDTVKEFDRAALIDQFDKIRRTLIVNQ